MAKPNSRQTFGEYCLRSLGAPVINIEVADEQLDDKIDEAIQVYHEGHYDATELDWVSYVVTQADVDRGYIEIPDDILSVVDIMPMHSLFARTDMFSFQYQVARQQLSPWQSFSQVDYFMKITNYQSTMDMTSSDTRFEFVRHKDKLKVFQEFEVGYPLGFKVFRMLDPDQVTKIWNDKWLKQYATALIKKQWGSNLKKYDQVQMLGGVTINGQEIYGEAVEEIQRLEDELENVYQEPTDFIIG